MHASLTNTQPNTLHGILLLNKPSGFTSQQAVSKVKRLLTSKKAGHSGSLDPIATGLLPICLGEATKFVQFLLTADKHYRISARLGERTDTGDSEGNIVEERSVPLLSIPHIQATLAQFLGSSSQIPPVFSALKHQGKPLYHWARQGVKIQKEARPIVIYELKLLNYHLDQLTLEARCSKGTYIRTLIDDIGKQLGCGAHVKELHRLSMGQYTVGDSIDFKALESLDPIKRIEHVMPLNTMLPKEWPTFRISEPAAFYLRRGQALALPNIPDNEWVILVLKPDGKLLGIGRVLKDGRIAPHRLIETH